MPEYENNPHCGAVLDLVFVTNGLVPGAVYAATFRAVFDTGNDYHLGFSNRIVNSSGQVQFKADPRDLGYFNPGERIVEIQMWLRAPATPVTDVALDDTGDALFYEIDYY